MLQSVEDTRGLFVVEVPHCVQCSAVENKQTCQSSSLIRP